MKLFSAVLAIAAVALAAGALSCTDAAFKGVCVIAENALKPTASASTNFNRPPSISAETIQRVLAQAGSPAARENGFAGCLYGKGKAHGIDPAFALAYFAKESSYATSGVARTTKSIGNIRAGKSWSGESYSGFRKYRSFCDGATDWFELIARNGPYFRAGRYALEEIEPVYAPASENNVQQNIAVVKRKLAEYARTEFGAA